MPSNFIYYDLSRGIKSDNINLVFDNWCEGNEKVVILSPHDDDALLGSGYLMLASMKSGGEVYLMIYCDGRGGYSDVNLKEKIVSIRKKETINAYTKLGVKEENVLRLDYPDFSLKSHIGMFLPNNIEGTTFKTIKILRQIKSTRLLIPNEYKEHADHEALSYVGSYDGPQVGDPVVVDLGQPSPIKSYLKYCVWGDFSPEDAFITNRDPSLRGNIAIKVERKIEEEIIQALEEFKSQKEIISNIIVKRKDRMVNGYYIEVYQKFNPRPEIDYKPYKKKIMEIDGAYTNR